MESESARDRFLAGLRAGWIDESMGITEPVPAYPDSNVYMAGVRRGRAAWRMESESAMVVDAPAVIHLGGELWVTE